MCPGTLRFVLVGIFTITVATLSNSSTSTPFVVVNSEDLQIKQFITSDCDGYKSFLLHENVLYIGGRGALYRQNPVNISESVAEKIIWSATRKQQKECLSLPQGNADTCHNYIRVIQPYNSTHVMLCGSMALSSTNIFLDRKSGELRPHPGIESPLCSYSPSDPVTSVMGSKNNFATIAASSRPRPQTQIGIVKNLDQSYSLRTSQGQGEMISGNPTFAYSFRADDTRSDHVMNKLYFVFGESVDQRYNRQNIGTKIAQVCANDEGDPWNQAWTSFLKVPLLCQTDENDPFQFNTVTHGTVWNGILYGTFNIESSIIGSAAVCAFRISDIQKAFRTRKFWSLSLNGDYQITSSNIPKDPDPGDCAYPGMEGDPNATSWNFRTEFTYFMKNHPAVADSVTPVHPLKTTTSGPLLTREKESFTQIQVQPVVDATGRNHTILFIGTKSGKLIKFVSLIKDKKIDDFQLAEYKLGSEAVTGLMLSPRHHQLYVQTASRVEQISTANCDIYPKSCSFCDSCCMCLTSRDPMCAWDGEACTNDFSGKFLVQNVTYGGVRGCGKLNVDENLIKVPQLGSAVILGKPVTNPSITAQWFNETKCGELHTKEDLTSSKASRYQITPDQRLEINSFTVHDVRSTFIAQYKINEQVVGTSQITFQLDNLTPSPTTIPTIRNPTMKPSLKPERTFSNEQLSNSTSSIVPPTLAPEPVTAQSSVIIVIGIVVVVLLLILGIWFWKKRNGKCKAAKSTADSSFLYDERHPPISNTGFASKNYRMGDSCDGIGKAFFPESDAAGANVEKNSLLQSDDISYIDDPPPTPPASPYLGYVRNTPRRTKSIPARDIVIRITGDKSLKYNSIRRHRKRGTYFIEFDPGDMEIDCDDSAVEMASLNNGDYEKVAGAQSIEDLTTESEHNNCVPAISLNFGDSNTLPFASNKNLFAQAQLSSGENTPRQFVADKNCPKAKLLSSSYNPRSKNRSQAAKGAGDSEQRDADATSSEAKDEGLSSASSSEKYETAPSSPTPIDET